jgi:putative membrane protein
MRYGALSLFLIGALSAGASAQTAPPQAPAAPAQAPTGMPPAAARPMTSSTPATPPAPARADAAGTTVVEAGTLEQGANSFTEGQAQGRFEDAGFTGIQGLVKDDAGFWRARGMRGGATVDLAMDFRGRIAAGPGATALPRQAGSTGAVPSSGATTTTPR